MMFTLWMLLSMVKQYRRCLLSFPSCSTYSFGPVYTVLVVVRVCAASGPRATKSTNLAFIIRVTALIEWFCMYVVIISCTNSNCESCVCYSGSILVYFSVIFYFSSQFILVFLYIKRFYSMENAVNAALLEASIIWHVSEQRIWER
jgi:hypothetical protein